MRLLVMEKEYWGTTLIHELRDEYDSKLDEVEKVSSFAQLRHMQSYCYKFHICDFDLILASILGNFYIKLFANISYGSCIIMITSYFMIFSLSFILFLFNFHSLITHTLSTLYHQILMTIKRS